MIQLNSNCNEYKYVLTCIEWFADFFNVAEYDF